MLIQYSVANFKTFKEKATLSLVASAGTEKAAENIFDEKKFRLRTLKSAVIYGANASGKSKLIEALAFMKKFVAVSANETQKGELIPVDPFRLNTESENKASEFEVIFTFKDVMYRYGFEADRNRIVSEWLFYKPHTKEICLFVREGQDFETHPRNFGIGAFLVKRGMIRDNALLLSFAAQNNEPISANVLEWFRKINIVSGLNEDRYMGFTMRKAQDARFKEDIVELLKAADLGIQDIELEKLDMDKLPKHFPAEFREMLLKQSTEAGTEIFSGVSVSRSKFDGIKKHSTEAIFSMEEDESSGTRKFFALTGPVLDALKHGNTLVVDELEAKLHPNLVCKLVSLFNSSATNPKNAQLIFNTHDTNLLGADLFRRDQVWFTEKNSFGEARLYSLSDFNSAEVRKKEPFEENYIRGKYGAVPYLGEFDGMLQEKIFNEAL